MVKYHVNPETGVSGRCSAGDPDTGRGCPFSGDNGTENHFDTAAEAEKASQKILEKNYGTFATETKKNKTISSFIEPARSKMNNNEFNWVGNKASKSYTPTKEIAKNIRQDLKNATKSGYLPEGIKYSVTTTYNSIDITVSNLGRDRDVYNYDYQPNGKGRVLKPEYKELKDKVQLIHDSYNFNSSNPMIDYFNYGYSGYVKMLDEGAETDKAYTRAANRFNRIIEAKEKANTPIEEMKKDPEIIEASINCDEKLKELYASIYRYRLDYDAFKHNVQPDWEEIDKKAEQYAIKQYAAALVRRRGKELKRRR